MTTTCVKCGNTCPPDALCIVDGKNICTSCMYNGIQPVLIYPIGFVVNSQERASTGFGLESKDRTSRIQLLESQKPFMYRLEDEKNITVIYYLHRSRPVKSVFNRGLDSKKVGVFASRTPDRLSRLAIQDVRIDHIEGTTIYVEGLDAVNGTPVLDIKMCWSNL